MRKRLAVRLGLTTLCLSATAGVSLAVASCSGEGNTLGSGQAQSSSTQNAITGTWNGKQEDDPAKGLPDDTVNQQDSESNNIAWSAAQRQSAVDRAREQLSNFYKLDYAYKINDFNDEVSISQVFADVKKGSKSEGYLSEVPNNYGLPGNDDYSLFLSIGSGSIFKYLSTSETTIIWSEALKTNVTHWLSARPGYVSVSDLRAFISLIKYEYQAAGIEYLLVTQEDFVSSYKDSFIAAATANNQEFFGTFGYYDENQSGLTRINGTPADDQLWYALFLYMGLRVLPRLGNYLTSLYVYIKDKDPDKRIQYIGTREFAASVWAALYFIDEARKNNDFIVVIDDEGIHDGTTNIQREASLYAKCLKSRAFWTGAWDIDWITFFKG